MSRRLFYIVCALIVGTSSCKDDGIYNGDCFIPEVAVNEVVNMSLPSYFHLQSLGGHVMLDAGNKGIFLVHNYDDQFYAVERTCTYQSDQSCSEIHVDSFNLRLRCGTYADTGFVECCASKFQFSGLLTEGPARCNLKPYRVAVDGNNIYVTN